MIITDPNWDIIRSTHIRFRSPICSCQSTTLFLRLFFPFFNNFSQLRLHYKWTRLIIDWLPNCRNNISQFKCFNCACGFSFNTYGSWALCKLLLSTCSLEWCPIVFVIKGHVYHSACVHVLTLNNSCLLYSCYFVRCIIHSWNPL